MADENQFSVVSSPKLIWPTPLQLPSSRFRLLVAADTTRVTVDQISGFATAALTNGMVYLCAWGLGCERFHDIVDKVIVEDESSNRRFAGPMPNDVIMTTWHENDSLEECLDFFATCAVPTDGYAAESSYRLVICVANLEWASKAARFLRAAEFLI